MLILSLAVVGCRPGEASDRSEPSEAGTAAAEAGVTAACRTLTSRICAELGEQTETCELATMQTGRLGEKRCSEMLQRYGQVVADLKRRAAGAKRLADPEQMTLGRPPPAFGPLDAKLTVVAFADFASAACARASGMARSIRNLHPDTVRFVFRQFPLSSQPQARTAAEASLAANAQGKFWDYHDALFGNQHALDREALTRYAQAVGLDLPKFERALDEKQFAADVDADLELGRKVSVQQVPAMFVNGRAVRVPYGVDALSRMIDAALLRE